MSKLYRLTREPKFTVRKSRVPDSCLGLGVEFVNQNKEKYLTLYLIKWYIDIGFMF